MFFTITHLSFEYCHGLLVVFSHSVVIFIVMDFLFVFTSFLSSFCLVFPEIYLISTGVHYFVTNTWAILFQVTQFIRTVLPDTHSNNDKRTGQVHGSESDFSQRSKDH